MHQLIQPAWIIASDSESSELVASSRIRIRGSRQQRPRNRKPLPLPARELHAALAHNRVVGIRKALGKLIHARRAACKQELLFGRIGPRKHDVLANRAIEEKRVLQHHAQLRPKGIQVHVRKIDTIHQHASLRRRVERAKQADDRRLA